jgi:hypothetical protein
MQPATSRHHLEPDVRESAGLMLPPLCDQIGRLEFKVFHAAVHRGTDQRCRMIGLTKGGMNTKLNAVIVSLRRSCNSWGVGKTLK